MNEMVKSYLRFEKLCFDAYVIEFKIEVSDGSSVFSNTVYTEEADFEKFLEDLDKLCADMHGGLCNMKWGEFGPEHANGVFQAELCFSAPGKVYISTHQQSMYKNFLKNEVASEAKLYIKTEPALLNNFVSELHLLKGEREVAVLQCI